MYSDSTILIDSSGEVRQHRKRENPTPNLPDTTKKTIIARSMKQATKELFNAFADDIEAMIKQGYNDNILHNPRFVMYKLLKTTKDGITITKKMDKKISGVINVLKYQGRISNNMTIDVKRSVSEYNHFRDRDDAQNYIQRAFYLDRWKHQPRRLILMCEASGYLGVIRNIANQFRIPYTSASGDMSVQIKIEIADMCDMSPTTIIYYGDNDTKGLSIPKTIEADIRALRPHVDLLFHRLFLNEGDIKKYGLPEDAQMEQLPEQIAIEESVKFINTLIDHKTMDETIAKEEKIRKSFNLITKDPIC